MDIFVPGRICLFGEHSDWAGHYRTENPSIGRGYTLIAGTSQGIYATVAPHPDKLVFRAVTDSGAPREVELAMDSKSLRQEAGKGGFFSYVAGTASEVIARHEVGGLEITNTLTDLPVKKGLSSSAAVCVLVARAFNMAYDLGLSIRDEMEYAYLGEIATPSRCGRMDQGCAYGNRPIMMTFDGNQLDKDEIDLPSQLHLVVADLAAEKDTMEILARLNDCYPNADTPVKRAVQEYLGPINARIVHSAADAMRSGDARRIGELMTEAQAEFDRCLAPACPGQLTAPALHRVLDYAPLRKYILGGKGVGSQGDGSAQFIVEDAERSMEALALIEKDLGMSCIQMTIG